MLPLYSVEIWCSWNRAWWCISIVNLTRCTLFEFIEYHSTFFGRSSRPSSGVQDCTHSIRYMPYRLVATNLYDIYLTLCVQSWTPDYGWKDRPKNVEWYSINLKVAHLAGFTVEKSLKLYGIRWTTPVSRKRITYQTAHVRRKKVKKVIV